MRHACLVGLMCLLPVSVAAAPPTATSVTPPPSAASVTDLPAVVVTGSQPDPGLWKVTHNGHVMWILGVTTPLPKRMQWQSADVEQAIAGSQEVLESPTIKVKTNVGFFGKLLLLPSLLHARKNPDGATLQQRVSPDDYARWLVLKRKYIGRDHGIERWRPIFAALKLYRAALKARDLRFGGGVEKAVEHLAQKHRVTLTPVVWHVQINDPRAAIKQFTRNGLDDTTCFHRTMITLQQQLPVIAARANAWAIGDIAALRRLPLDGQRQACIDAVSETALARQTGIDTIAPGIEAIWLDAVDKAMRTNQQTFALLPMRELLKRTGPLTDLRALGYTVQSPHDLDLMGDRSP